MSDGQLSAFETYAHQGTKPADPQGTGAKSYQEIQEDLGDRQAQVLAQLKINGPLTDSQVADRLKCPRSSVNGRRNELVKMGYVTDHDTTEGPYGKEQARWKVTEGLFD